MEYHAELTKALNSMVEDQTGEAGGLLADVFNALATARRRLDGFRKPASVEDEDAVPGPESEKEKTPPAETRSHGDSIEASIGEEDDSAASEALLGAISKETSKADDDEPVAAPEETTPARETRAQSGEFVEVSDEELEAALSNSLKESGLEDVTREDLVAAGLLDKPVGVQQEGERDEVSEEGEILE